MTETFSELAGALFMIACMFGGSALVCAIADTVRARRRTRHPRGRR